MLDALQVEDGMRVLEIGTGTGWNAALLGYRVGAENVVIVEIDGALAEHARGRLAENGYPEITVVPGDGAVGWPDRAPYDRVIATVAARKIPYAWVAQTRPGGQLVTPWGTDWYPGGLPRLTVAEDGVATGRIVGDAAFMALRAQRRSRWGAGAVLGGGTVRASTTDLHPWYVAEHQDAATAVGLWVPDCSQFYVTDAEGGRLNLVDQKSGSWARVGIGDGPPYPVEQAGARSLWDEVRAAHQAWNDKGRPGRDSWLVTVEADIQWTELDPAGTPSVTP